MTINDIAALIDKGEFAAALSECDRLLAQRGGNVPALVNRGLALLGLGDAAQARRSFNRAINEDPTIGGAWDGLGKAFYDLGRPDKAAEAFQSAAHLTSDPATPLYHRGMAQLAAGEFGPGWEGYEHRLAVTGIQLRHYGKPRWTGEPLDGRRLLVTAEQGFGDMIQFARFLPQAAARGGPVGFEAPAQLLPLFAPLAEAATLIATEDGPVPLDRFDCHCHLMSLAGLFGVTKDTVPVDIPYIAAPAGRVAAWRDELHGDRKVGLAWTGRPTHPQDRQRSMDSAQLLPLREFPDLSLYSLQKEPAGRPLAPALAAGLRADLGPRLTDFAETAAVIENLDLVITVDTVIAHLAGALGRPVWLLLPFAADWRWMRGRDDTPWYPSMRLFRQERAGDWDGVVARVCDAL